ncbi:nicotinate (nicotinamide) nucleotide adenylyltransferase [Nitratiruptor sp. YY09-18]|uniref:nicotinate (nicotinamide) nucleotide adenylyltransferase n=1 Tax=Nitratiruptor sp. YY09-18 TaxID=2724901 RepID=UPI001916AE87|nr:nicotinate (nicotinamide) nucleotide adenylyltransferase [Nitratiruptor sp. YY09-18]BCD68593.1 nicotinate-nucleotide adenylyltransferase [Nitratiruptor sp. YY09-18]
MHIAIFGGSFDPPHTGHVAIVKKALEDLDIDLLVIVPTYLNPFKQSFKAPPKKRLQWLKKIFMYQSRVKICDFEIRNNRPTYAIETVAYLRKRYKPQKIYYIIGSDNVSSLHKWHQYRKLSHLVEFVIATRRGYEAPYKFKRLEVDVPVSSTMLRKHPQKRYLPKQVAWEIIRFYRA